MIYKKHGQSAIGMEPAWSLHCHSNSKFLISKLKRPFKLAKYHMPLAPLLKLQHKNYSKAHSPPPSPPLLLFIVAPNICWFLFPRALCQQLLVRIFGAATPARGLVVSIEIDQRSLMFYRRGLKWRGINRHKEMIKKVHVNDIRK